MIDFKGKEILKLKYDRSFENQHYLVPFKNRIKLNILIFIIVVGFYILNRIFEFNLGITMWRIVGWIGIALTLFFFYNFFYVLVVPMNFAFHKPIYIVDDKAILYGNYEELHESSKSSNDLIAMKMIFNKIDSVLITRSFIVIRGNITRKVFNNHGGNDPWEEIVDEKLDIVRIPRKFINEDDLLKYLKA